MTEIVPRTTDRTDPEALARSALARVDRHDLDGLAQVWHPELELWFVAMDLRVSQAGAREQFAQIFAAFPDFTITPTRVLVDGDVATVAWQASGTHTGAAYQGIARTGKRVEIQGLDVMEFDDGLLRRNTVYYDGLAVARALGLLPPDGSVADRAMRAMFNLVTRLRGLLRR